MIDKWERAFYAQKAKYDKLKKGHDKCLAVLTAIAHSSAEEEGCYSTNRWNISSAAKVLLEVIK